MGDLTNEELAAELDQLRYVVREVVAALVRQNMSPRRDWAVHRTVRTKAIAAEQPKPQGEGGAS